MLSKIVLPALLTIIRLFQETSLPSNLIVNVSGNGYLRGPATAFNEDDYYPSLNPTSWNVAETDCQRIFQEAGREGGLVSIESEAELKFLNRILEKYGSGKKYWTSGMYSREWLWGSTGEPIDAFARPPPISGGRTPSIQDRLVMNVVNRFTANFESIPDSQAQRYICEVTRNEEPTSTTTTPKPSRCSPPSTSSPPILVNGNDGSSPNEVGMCPNTAQDFEITYAISQSVPLDVYVLMDFSGSMGGMKESMVRLSNDLVKKVQELSNDYLIGFGAFVDKPAPGYASDYSFKNSLPLTKDTARFKAVVDAEQIISSSGDVPESQLDALFQAAVCTTQIGWRSNARHIVLLITDNGYHKAGDGAPSTTGMQPFNGACGILAVPGAKYANPYDYPSEEQIIDILKKNEIIPIFAVKSHVVALYQKLADRIKPSAVGPLNADGANVVQLLAEQYGKISNNVKLEMVGVVNSALSIRYFSDCNNSTAGMKETSVCEGVGGTKVTFRVKVSLGDCKSKGVDQSERIKIRNKAIITEIPVKLYCE